MGFDCAVFAVWLRSWKCWSSTEGSRRTSGKSSFKRLCIRRSFLRCKRRKSVLEFVRNNQTNLKGPKKPPSVSDDHPLRMSLEGRASLEGTHPAATELMRLMAR